MAVTLKLLNVLKLKVSKGCLLKKMHACMYGGSHVTLLWGQSACGKKLMQFFTFRSDNGRFLKWKKMRFF